MNMFRIPGLPHVRLHVARVEGDDGDRVLLELGREADGGHVGGSLGDAVRSASKEKIQIAESLVP